MRPLSGKGSHLLGGILHRKQPLATGAGAFAQERGGSAAAAAASAAAAADRHGVSVQGTVYSVHRSVSSQLDFFGSDD